MSTIVRLILVGILFGAAILIIKAVKIPRKRSLYGILAGVSVALLIGLYFLPFENLFVTFDSPQNAYEYYYWESSEIELVVEGEQCDFVVDRNGGADKLVTIPKTADGWKLGTAFDTRRVAQSFFEGISVQVYQYKDTKDYFITIIDTAGGESQIADGYNTQFYFLETTHSVSEKTFITYYAHIPNFDLQYVLTVNGKTIPLTQA